MMWWEWTTAILVASLLGSGHCVGMCGPFAVLAASPSAESSRATRWGALVSYHVGRWMTYVILGALLGGLGSVADGVAVSAGLTPVAARGVGGLMVLMGLTLVVRWWRGRRGVVAVGSIAGVGVAHSGWTARWNQGLLAVRKRWRVRSPAAKAFSWGLISTWLPCGWLYVFAIAAAGAGGALWGMALMTAFWLGTLPLLSLVPIGAWWISRTAPPSGSDGVTWHARMKRWVTSAQPWVQPASACLLIAFGVFTATSRAEISLANLKLDTPSSSQDQASSQDQGSPASKLRDVSHLYEVIDQKLPCCAEGRGSAVGSADEEAHESGDRR